MSCRSETVRTWYDLIRASLLEDAAKTVLSAAQLQTLAAGLKQGKVVSDP